MGTITPFVPYPKGFVKYLPKITDRPYSKVEAGLCVMVDYDDQNPVTIRGYAKLWQWNKKTVSKFLKDHGAMIIYPKSTGDYKNQRGLIGILKRDQSGTNQGPIRFIDNRDLDSNRDQSGTNKGPIRDQSVSPTIEPKPDPEPKPKETYPKSFLKLFTDYPNTNGSKSQTFKNWKATKKILKEDEIYSACMNSAEKQKLETTGEPFYFQLSNLLSPRKYQGDLPVLVDWKPDKGNKKQIEPPDDHYQDVAQEREENLEYQLSTTEEKIKIVSKLLNKLGSYHTISKDESHKNELQKRVIKFIKSNETDRSTVMIGINSIMTNYLDELIQNV